MSQLNCRGGPALLHRKKQKCSKNLSAFRANLDYLAKNIATSHHSGMSIQPHSCKWHVPKSFPFKCNVDTAFNEHNNCMGFGMILRGGNGEFIACRFAFIAGLAQIEEGKPWVLMRLCFGYVTWDHLVWSSKWMLCKCAKAEFALSC